MNLKENVDIYFVAPFTGAWIEIRAVDSSVAEAEGRSLHGSVD